LVDDKFSVSTVQPLLSSASTQGTTSEDDFLLHHPISTRNRTISFLCPIASKQSSDDNRLASLLTGVFGDKQALFISAVFDNQGHFQTKDSILAFIVSRDFDNRPRLPYPDLFQWDPELTSTLKLNRQLLIVIQQCNL
jgi:hypothetical protein